MSSNYFFGIWFSYPLGDYRTILPISFLCHNFPNHRGRGMFVPSTVPRTVVLPLGTLFTLLGFLFSNTLCAWDLIRLNSRIDWYDANWMGCCLKFLI